VSIRGLSLKLGDYLSQLINEPGKAPVLAYGLELIIGESVKLLILILSAYLMGLLTPMLFFLSTAVPLRVLTGGQHCSSSFRCLITTLIFFSLLVFLSESLIGIISGNYLLLFALISSVIFVIIIEYFGPGYSINYKEHSGALTRKVKKHTYISITLWLLVLLIFMYLVNDLKLQSLFITSSSFGVLWQGFLVTPPGHLFIRAVDNGLLLAKVK